jgi:hypothetical protein
MTATATPYAPFTPKGEVARHVLVYDELTGKEPGFVLTYEVIEGLCDGRRDFAAVDRARRTLERDDLRTLENVRGVGYRVVDADEHARLGQQHFTRSRRQVRKARARLNSARRDELTPEGQAELERISERVSRLESAHRAQARRVERIAEMHEEHVEVSDRRIADLEAAVARINEKFTE